MASDTQATSARDGCAFTGVILAWAIVYLWLACWVWSFFPSARNTWWEIPAIITTMFGAIAPLFGFALWDMLREWSKED
jgi:membrane protein YdbS with pleckstrin-like domain